MVTNLHFREVPIRQEMLRAPFFCEKGTSSYTMAGNISGDAATPPGNNSVEAMRGFTMC
jgi:hypothetical protein